MFTSKQKMPKNLPKLEGYTKHTGPIYTCLIFRNLSCRWVDLLLPCIQLHRWISFYTRHRWHGTFWSILPMLFAHDLCINFVIGSLIAHITWQLRAHLFGRFLRIFFQNEDIDRIGKWHGSCKLHLTWILRLPKKNSICFPACHEVILFCSSSHLPLPCWKSHAMK